jgi:hydroxymethylbilane synthase
VNTVLDGDSLTLTGIVASLDGKTLVKDSVTGSATEAEKLGTQLAKRLRQQGAQTILDEILATLDRS